MDAVAAAREAAGTGSAAAAVAASIGLVAKQLYFGSGGGSGLGEALFTTSLSYPFQIRGSSVITPSKFKHEKN